jgi:hypothetical protein
MGSALAFLRDERAAQPVSVGVKSLGWHVEAERLDKIVERPSFIAERTLATSWAAVMAMTSGSGPGPFAQAGQQAEAALVG